MHLLREAGEARRAGVFVCGDVVGRECDGGRSAAEHGESGKVEVIGLVGWVVGGGGSWRRVWLGVALGKGF